MQLYLSLYFRFLYFHSASIVTFTMTKFMFKYLIPTGPVLLLTIVEFVLYNLSSDDTVVQDSEINKL